ncbi:unnamed protein product [Oikopleura dioica]|uniref:PH domain-containing protein n=2 Tax=Oikopleura dioica TaxID=34765 RepID=E4XDJ8_OIKDI|nr:unnamed protein product [Oikopleura dioica]
MGEYRAEPFSDYGSVAASVIDQLPIEEILRRNTRKATLETLRANGIILEDDLAELTDTQLEVMGINMVERRKVLAQTDSIRRRKRRLSQIRERVDISCRETHKRASKVFLENPLENTPNPSFRKIRYSTYGLLCLPDQNEMSRLRGAINPANTEHKSTALKRTTSMPTAKPRRLLEKKHSIDEKNMDSKSLDSVGGFMTDGDSIGTSDEHDGPLSSTIKDDGFETESSQAHSELPLPDIEGLKRELTIKLARPVPIRARREDFSPQTPAAIATSIRLMGIWHAYHILEQVKNGSSVNIIDLRKIVRLASAHSGEKNPETILRELERREGSMKNFGYVDLKDILVSHYSSNPLGITPQTLETEVWEDYFQETISKIASENGISLTVCFLLWQVFNRLADEFHFPPRLERPDMQKILQKTTRFFSKTHARYECINERDYEPLPFLDFLLILWREAKNENMSGKDPSLELAKELHTVFVLEELRAGSLSKRVNALKWNKRFFSVVPFELRWWPNAKREGNPRSFPLDQNTKITQNGTKLEVVNGKQRLRLKGSDEKSVMRWTTAISLVYRAHATTLTPRQSQLVERRQGGSSPNQTIHV